jgi:hypothetical protein
MDCRVSTHSQSRRESNHAAATASLLHSLHQRGFNTSPRTLGITRRNSKSMMMPGWHTLGLKEAQFWLICPDFTSSKSEFQSSVATADRQGVNITQRASQNISQIHNLEWKDHYHSLGTLAQYFKRRQRNPGVGFCQSFAERGGRIPIRVLASTSMPLPLSCTIIFKVSPRVGEVWCSSQRMIYQ